MPVFEYTAPPCPNYLEGFYKNYSSILQPTDSFHRQPWRRFRYRWAGLFVSDQGAFYGVRIHGVAQKPVQEIVRHPARTLCLRRLQLLEVEGICRLPGFPRHVAQPDRWQLRFKTGSGWVCAFASTVVTPPLTLTRPSCMINFDVTGQESLDRSERSIPGADAIFNTRPGGLIRSITIKWSLNFFRIVQNIYNPGNGNLHYVSVQRNANGQPDRRSQ